MKRCPKCNRVESDDGIAFCRVDGSPLKVDEGVNEVETSILPHITGDSVKGRSTGPTTILAATNAQSPTSELNTAGQTSEIPRRHVASTRNSLIAGAVGIVLVTALGVGSYLKYRRTDKQINSIAVMPFVNESGNAEAEYLSDGMTETLIKSLSNLPNLSVKPRSTVFRYKGKETDLHTIAKELNVQAILNGRVVQRGDQLSVSLELVDAQKDSVIWTERYQRETSDLVSLQGEIARDVSTKLKSKLSGAEETQVTKSATADPAAYQAYLKGRYYWNRRTTENIKKAMEQFKIATDRDPNYALAFVGLADCYGVLNEYAGIPSSETLPKARSYAERALALDSQLAEPHATLGLIHDNSWQWAESEKEFKRAIEMNPNYATAYHWYSILLRALGKNDEAAAMVHKAHELDPMSSVINVNVSRVYQMQNKTEASIENSLKLIELDPHFAPAYQYLGLSYLKQGRNAEAITALKKAAELSGGSGITLADLGYGYAATGNQAEALAIIKRLEDKYARRESLGQYLAVVYMGLGNRDKAFEWLEKDYEVRNGKLPEIRWQQQFESIRDDARYKDLLRRMNLPV